MTAIIVCFVLMLVFAAAGCALAVRFRRDLKTVVRILGATVFLMLFAAVYPSYAVRGEGYAFGLALVQSMCAMLLNADAGEILSAFDGYDAGFLAAYKAVLLALLIVGPLFTVGITLSFFAEKFARAVYRVRSSFADSYLFSEVNERTLCVAEDIARKNKRAVIVFAVQTEDGVDAGSLGRIKEIGAGIVNDDIVNVAHSSKHTRNYYLLGGKGSENLDAGLRLYQKYNQKTCKVNMWLYTKGEISKVIFDHLYETFNVRLMNEESLISRRLVTDHPLYEAVQEGRLSLLLVGGGKIGLEILRQMAACACLGIPVTIDVIDRDAEEARAVFGKTSPGLAEKWGISFHSADVRSADFLTVLQGLRPTYVAVTLGDEERNMETALDIRRIYGEGPRIYVLVDHKRVEEQILPNLRLSDWKFDPKTVRYERTYLCSFGIETFGSYEDTYSDLRVGARYLDCLAVAVCAANCGITALNERYSPALLCDLYNQVMFYKDYSDGYAVSVPYKLYLMGLELCDDGRGDLSLLEERLPAYTDVLRRHENRRYEAFMRGNGWTDLPPEEIRGGLLGDKLSKRHARLDDTHVRELEALTGRDFRKEDERAVCRFPVVLRLANQLYGRSFSVRERK